jgi:hypothetical protein
MIRIQLCLQLLEASTWLQIDGWMPSNREFVELAFKES